MKNSVIHNYWLKYENKYNDLLKNFNILKKYSDWQYTHPWLSLEENIGGIYQAIKDGILLGEYSPIIFSKIHSELGKKYNEIDNSEFFTPDNIAYELANKINSVNKNNDYVLEIGTGLGSILQYINNGVGIELSPIYTEICNNLFGLNVLNLDIIKENLNNKFKLVCANPPFGANINSHLFRFLKENTTDDMYGLLLLPNNYDDWLEKYGFEIICKTNIKEKFTNTNIKTTIYEIKKYN